MKKEQWLFIDSNYRSPFYNMALDEALLEWHAQAKIPPVVRFYNWEPASLSIGYFQQANKEIDFDAVKKYNLGFVRRPTGGRAVLHDKELTYSVIVSENHSKMPSTVTEAYRVISEGILKGFIKLGLNAYFSVPETDKEKEELKNPRSSVCFDAPSWYELVVEGRKAAGSAQTRQKGVILQHGSILLDLDDDMLFDVFNFPNEKIKERMKRGFKERAVAINQLLEKKVSLDEAKKAFFNGFEEALEVEFVPYQLSQAEEDYVQTLAKNKYALNEWNFKK